MRSRLRRNGRLSASLLSITALAGFFGALPTVQRTVSPEHTVAIAPSATVLPSSLVPGRRVERRIRGGEVQRFAVRLAAGESLHLAVEHEGAHVVLSLVDPAGERLLTVDRPDGPRGTLEVWAIAVTAGDHRLEVAGEAGAGLVRLRLDPPRRATVADRLRAAALRALSDGDRLRRRASEKDLLAAQSRYREAMALAARAGDSEQRRLALYRLAAVDVDRSRYAESLRAYHAIQPFWRGRPETVALLAAIGGVFEAQGRPAEALEVLSRASSEAERLGDRRGNASALNTLAQVHRARGEFQAALAVIGQAIEDFHALGLAREEADALTTLGQVRLDAGDPPRAIEACNRALVVQRQCGGRGAALSLHTLGSAYAALEQWAPAVERFQGALTLAVAQGDLPVQIAAANGLGWVYYRQGRLAEAVALLEKAGRLARAASDRRDEGNALGNLGATYSALGETTKAVGCFDRARTIYRRLHEPESEASILRGKALALERAGRLDEAHATIGASLDLIEDLRTQSVGSDLRARFFASQQDNFELDVRVLTKLDRLRPGRGYDGLALATGERMRARSLLDELAAAHLDVRAGAGPELRAKEKKAERRLREAERARTTAAGRAGAGQLADLDAALRARSSELEAVRGEMRQRSLRYAALTDPHPLGSADIQREVLDDDTLLLAYSLAEPNSFLWSVDRTALHLHLLPGRRELEALASTTYRSLARSNTTEGGRDATRDVAELSKALLGPVASELGARRLVIVADGALEYIPFAVLPEPPVPGGPAAGAEPPPLMLAHEIAFLPSASILPMLRREAARRRPAEKLVAVLADPVFRGDDPRMTGSVSAGGAAAAGRSAESDAERSARDVGVDALHRLPYTRREADSILALVPRGLGLEATDFRASRDLAVSPDLRHYQVLHFATHGFLDAVHPELSGLVLSQFDEQGRPRDGFLHSYEIYGLKLSADLVVLSACRTALGAQVRGEGLVGLTRGFMYAGAPRVLVSLWNINDRATADLMDQFYRGVLLRHRSPAAALREAQLAIWKQRRWHAPYYWGAFVLQGDWR